MLQLIKLTLCIFCISGALPAYSAPDVVAVIRAEALRANDDPTGRPLPLVAHWHRLTMPLSVQVQMVFDEIPILPWLNYGKNLNPDTLDAAALAQLSAWKLPLSLIHGNQWEDVFYTDAEYKALPIEETGVGQNLDGSRMAAVSPMSPIQPWYDLGIKWTANAYAERLQQLYPSPPRVFFVSNNEASRVKPLALDTEKRWVDIYGFDFDVMVKRQESGDRNIDRYGALFDGMTDGLVASKWKKNSRFVGYGAFGPDKWGSGAAYGGPEVTPEYISWDARVWDGTVCEAYDNPWEPAKLAYFLWSMQVELMNHGFQQEHARAYNPEFWYELITWDGYLWRDTDEPKALAYAAAGVTYTPDLYEGWSQYAMWTLTPRVVREYRSSTDDKVNWWPYFERIIAMVQRVHHNPTLLRFWRSGDLVLNESRPHPFNYNLPPQWSDIPRWSHLATNLDPDLSDLPKTLENWKNNPAYIMPVLTMARVIGTAPSREWLIYAHAPLGAREDVSVTVPGYGDVTLPSIGISGDFYLLSESGSLQQVTL